MTDRSCRNCNVRPVAPKSTECGPCLYRKYRVDECACGKPKRKSSATCRKCSHYRGELHNRWKTGRKSVNGYVLLHRRDHPRAQKSGYILEHVLVMEEKIGRHLHPGENVHHINGVRDDNRPENLELWTKSQPAGQRVEDKLRWAKEFITQYTPSPATDRTLGAKTKIACLDFDDTLAKSLWTPENMTRQIGPPIHANIAKAKQLADEGYTLVIHTARGWEDAEYIESWLTEHGVPFRNVTCGKPIADVYVDDKALFSEDWTWMPGTQVPNAFTLKEVPA